MHVFQYCKAFHALRYELIHDEKFMIRIRIVWPLKEWHVSLYE